MIGWPDANAYWLLVQDDAYPPYYRKLHLLGRREDGWSSSCLEAGCRLKLMVRCEVGEEVHFHFAINWHNINSGSSACVWVDEVSLECWVFEPFHFLRFQQEQYPKQLGQERDGETDGPMHGCMEWCWDMQNWTNTWKERSMDAEERWKGKQDKGSFTKRGRRAGRREGGRQTDRRTGRQTDK